MDSNPKYSPEIDYFDILGLDFNKHHSLPDNDQLLIVKKAFRQKALLHHPDTSRGVTDVSEFHAISIAYDVLRDLNLRQAYIQARKYFLSKRSRGDDDEPRSKEVDLKKIQEYGEQISTEKNPNKVIHILEEMIESGITDIPVTTRAASGERRSESRSVSQLLYSLKLIRKQLLEGEDVSPLINELSSIFQIQKNCREYISKVKGPIDVLRSENPDMTQITDAINALLSDEMVVPLANSRFAINGSLDLSGLLSTIDSLKTQFKENVVDYRSIQVTSLWDLNKKVVVAVFNSMSFYDRFKAQVPLGFYRSMPYFLLENDANKKK